MAYRLHTGLPKGHDLALTFMDIAEVSQTEETVRRNHDSALPAHDTVVRLLAQLMPMRGKAN